MLIRALCLSLVLLAGPASPWVPAPCCAASDECCAGDAPSCPLAPSGECSLAAAHVTLATAGTGHVQVEAPLGRAGAVMLEAAAAPRTALQAFPDSPPAYLLKRSLRN